MPRLGQPRGPGTAARSPSSRHSGNLKTATPSPESHPSGDAKIIYQAVLNNVQIKQGNYNEKTFKYETLHYTKCIISAGSAGLGIGHET